MSVTGLPPVSVLIPLYNGVELLAECVQSLRDQTHPQWEALIGVNGHPEGSLALERARALSDERVRVLHYPDIRSAPQTLNRLARTASHPWVCLVDADDMWHPRKLERQLPALSLGVHVVGTLCDYFGDRGERPRLPSGHVPRSAFFRANPMIHSSVLRHAGSERNLWWSQKPWPFGRTPAQRPRLDSP